VLSDFGLSTGMAGSRNFLKTRCGTVHYISPEVAKGELYIGMSSDVWSCGIILFAMVTASLPFDGDNSVIVLKKIVKGEFFMPIYLPTELKDLIKKMLNVIPTERITISGIKKHPWYRLGATKEDLEDPVLLIDPFTVTLEEVQSNKPIIENLKLLGWDDGQLMDDLLAKEMNQAKIFYKYLTEHKHNPKQRPSDSPKNKESPLSKEEVSLHRRRTSESRTKSQGSSIKGHKYRPRSISRDKEKPPSSTTEETTENKENIDTITERSSEKKILYRFPYTPIHSQSPS